MMPMGRGGSAHVEALPKPFRFLWDLMGLMRDFWG